MVHSVSCCAIGYLRREVHHHCIPLAGNPLDGKIPMTGTVPALGVVRKIQLVEDEVLIAMDLKARLQSLGYSVTSIASTAEDALRHAMSDTPDLILMDIHLKGTRDGIQAADEIRKILDIPIVYLTAHADSATIARARLAGPFGYITKPFETTNLRVQIEIAISKHHTEQKLRESRAWLLTTLRNIGDAVIATDRAGRIEFMNPVAETLTGWSAKAAVGEFASRIFKMFDPETGDPVADPPLKASASEGLRTFCGEYNLRSLTGSLSHVQMVVSANQSENGKLLGLVIVFRDITRQREMERRTRESQNMEAVAIMAGGLAHDFNNLLTIILGYADFAKAHPGSAGEALGEIRKAGESATALCRQLLTVSRNNVIKAEIIDLNEPLHDSTRMLQQILGPKCRLVVNTCRASLPIASDRTQIQQVLINLCINARDAMPEGGTVTITTRRDNFDQAEIKVSDIGIGMAAETRRRIFEPFFSRKGGTGTGLGMTMVHSIITKWSGTIEVISETGSGTEFRILFPLSGSIPEPSSTAVALQPESSEDPADGTILLVEDNDAIRKLWRDQLESSGFTVFEAPSGEQALVFLEGHDAKIDLLITDVVMPGISGPELATLFLNKSPETGILFLSGYSEGELGDNKLMKCGRAEFLAKPLKPSQLIATASRMLAREPLRG